MAELLSSSSSSSELVEADRNLPATTQPDGMLLDITIECSSEDATNITLEGLRLTVADEREQRTDEQPLDRISPTKWEYRGIIELFHKMGQLVIILQSEGAGEFGFLDLTEEISRYLGDTAAVHAGGHRHKVVTEEGGPSLWVMFAVAALKQEQHRQSISALFSKYDRLLENAYPSEEVLSGINLYNVGTTLLRRFQETGSLPDISNAIENLQRAVSLTPKDHQNMPAYLDKLGTSLLKRFERTGDLDDVAAAIEDFQKLVGLTPAGHLGMPSTLNKLGVSFWRRFERKGDLADLSAAVEHLQKSVELFPDGHHGLPSALNNLGALFLKRFERTSDLADVSASIEYLRKSVGLTPGGHPDLSTALNTLGMSLMMRSNKTGDPDDMAASLEHLQNAMGLASAGHPNMPSGCHNLGNVFMQRFKQAKNLADLTAAIGYYENAVKLVPEGHADMPRHRSSLGYSLLSRYLETNKIAIGDCQAATLNYRLAATQATGNPIIRLDAARHWAACSGLLKNVSESQSAYNLVIELFPLVASLDKTIHNRHASLLGISNLTSEAVATALVVPDNETALKWFEQGRCLIWTQLNQLRTPIDRLREDDAKLADRFLVLSEALETSGSRPEASWRAGSTMSQQISVEEEVRLHLKLSREFEQLLANIRKLPRFNDFLRPPKVENIFPQLPTDGPIVLINVHRGGCNALALIHGTEEPIRITLNNFTYEKAETLRNQLGYHLTSEKLRMRDSDDRGGRLARRTAAGLRHLLRDLWNGVVWTILQGLGYSSPPAHRNRIWWCPTGPLAFLPIHAAGIYDPGAKVPRPCLSDFAVSSYIPTVTTLLEKLKNEATSKQQDTKVLLLSQPNGIAHAPIPGTIEETQSILNKMKNDSVEATLLEDEEGTKDRVTKNMGTHGWIHIASHASQHPTAPLKSGFYLHDGQLELLEIIRQRLPSAEFAYLSACQTSVGDNKLSEEAVHLAAGMLAAGYQGVMATMWAINDRYAPKIAEDFYGFLLEEKRTSGARRLDSRRAAYALDYATRKIRAKLGDSEHALLTWVPYIHLGL